MLAEFIGGFVAAEGTFTGATVGTQRRFTFAIALGATDRKLCEALPAFFDYGATRWSPRRRPHYDDEVTYRAQAIPDLVTRIVPFMDLWLPISYKRRQYEVWRADLVAYDGSRSRSSRGTSAHSRSRS